MDRHTSRWSIERVVVLAAIAVGVAAGTYGVASAASGSSSSQSSTFSAGAPVASAPSAGRPWGHRRSDETLLSGDAAAKVRQAAQSRLPGATIVRVETDADGNAAYEAHVVKADGSPATVYVNKQFQVVSVETGMPGPGTGSGRSSDGASA